MIPKTDFFMSRAAGQGMPGIYHWAIMAFYRNWQLSIDTMRSYFFSIILFIQIQESKILLINPLFLLLRSFQKFAKILFHFKPNFDKCEVINSNWYGIRTGYFIFSEQTQCKKQKWVEMLYPKDYIQDCLITLSSA